ncbi:MAG TPA: GIY-YIG nuclease family protein [Lacunisphaera sp.]|nr:GIY-YIG nuclease family protein [Lacunisphaera sp.]
MKRAHLYIVQCADGTLYTGIAVDVAQRVDLHNTGKGAKYTRSRGPVAVVYREGPMSRSRALRREHQVKRLTRAQKQALIAGRLRLARPR